jgi:hypothetical protein
MAPGTRTTKRTPKATKRDADRALREGLAPVLRARGFVGTLPHFHVAHPDDEAWVVSVQHDKYGGGFRAELAWVPPRCLFPQLYPSRPKRTSILKAWSVWPEFRELVVRGSGFVRYERDLAGATKRLVSAVGRAVPEWFEANRAVAACLGPKVSASTLRRLVSEATWVRQWIKANQHLPGCLAFYRGELAATTDDERRAQCALPLAKHGDRRAYALLVALLGDPVDGNSGRRDARSSLAGQRAAAVQLRAAQALAEVHGWPFRWDSSYVGRIRRRLSLAAHPTGEALARKQRP